MRDRGIFSIIFIIMFLWTAIANRKLFSTRGSRFIFICLSVLTIGLFGYYALGMSFSFFPKWLSDRVFPIFMNGKE